MLEDDYCSELCRLKYWPGSNKGHTTGHAPMRALLSTAAAATNAASESRHNGHYTEVLLSTETFI